MSAFFHTPEYKFLIELQGRLKILNTEKNHEIYMNHIQTCIKLVKEKYDNVGWREDLKSYAWVLSADIGPIMTEAESFYPGFRFYMSEDCMTWAMKCEKTGEVYRYTPVETDQLRRKSIKELQKIHYIKVTTGGTILDGEAKRGAISTRHKAKVKCKRR